ncbi:hypothetical protein FNV62_40265 [Streptomyces sp. RLB3-17]|uniref:hypothetical protein n=1 Tax=Streptomyces TaxID=1883 RepID=UPI0011621487|nr:MULTISPECIES: hypothetical protein [Streptomyces]MCX4420271.1 hypothetical protein [Streptomyces mirabilis]QDO43538.1 hypothetical protein FNV62_40265 [Streptomyces sp. RLB3-17]
MGDLNPAQCRKSVVDRFQPDAKASGYEAVYLRLATTESKPPAASADKQGAAAAKDLQPVA